MGEIVDEDHIGMAEEQRQARPVRYPLKRKQPEVVTLDTARRLGLKRYYTGQPCAHGHVAERLVARRACTECWNEARHDFNVRRRYRRLLFALKHRHVDPARAERLLANWRAAHPTP